MAITVNWATKVISVPKADLPLLQASPEIRELDLNWFRLQLKEIEESEEGIPFLDTHKHNTEVTLSGLTYARIVEIINGYTVEFEDGQYSVSCTGANHNLADVKVQNQASLIINNAAGLITNAQIEYSSFQGGVWIDAINGDTGTVFPRGTPQTPVNNLSDAKLIASTRGFNKLYILGNYTFGATDNIDDFVVHGENEFFSTLTIVSGCSTSNTEFEDCKLTGDLNGKILVKNSRVEDITGFVGILQQCNLSGTLGINGASSDLVEILHCYLGTAEVGLVTIDMGGDSAALSVRAYSGGLKITNKSGAAKVAIDFISGRLEIDSTVTAGTFFVRGVGEITDNQGTGITVNDTALVSPAAIWAELLADNEVPGSFGELINSMMGLVGENIIWSGMTHDSNHNLTGATITQYEDKTLGVIRKQWTLSATYDSNNELQTYQLTEV